MQTRLPQVDKLLRHPIIVELLTRYNRDVVLRLLRELMDELRAAQNFPDPDEIVAMLSRNLLELSSPSLKKLINGTGVVLNTNLGRAPIAESQIDKLKQIASYCNLEINLQSGKRGERASRLDKMLRALTGAQASIAVNNNAAALVLAVNCFALGKEVIVSRGELIEIGGSFRVPDVIESAGGILREVGTTNKTRISDFEKAIGPETGLVMRCHRSNFELRGFTEECKLADLVKLCREKGVPLLEDMGSGVLMDLAEIGMDDEPTLEQSIALDLDMVTFSGDKLLGGPQAGVISGKKEFVQKLAKHPLYRALRLDKLRISLLEQTLSSYFYARPEAILPALKMIAAEQKDLRERVARFIEKASVHLKQLKLQMQETSSTVGGGSLPGKEKPSAGIVLKSPWKSSLVAQALRACDPAVITINFQDENLIDFRTVFPAEEELLISALLQVEAKLFASDK